ncbi:MAG: hypothetical protein K2X81_00760, partial [Candidatus Obscuribacterales bacterium]|nr:hypothetical protein [Candidatus Obscuribacterales bacterium]
EVVFDRKGQNLVARGSNIVLPVDDLKQLLSAVQKSKTASKLDIASLGITPDSVIAHHDQIIAATRVDQIPSDVIRSNETVFDYPEVSKRLSKWLLSNNWSTNSISVRACIYPSSLAENRIEITSCIRHPGMLPWNVTDGKQKWSAYSLEISKALAKLADKKECRISELLDCGDYWNNKFWNDSDYWWWTTGTVLWSDYAGRIAKSLQGYDKAKQLFDLENFQIASYTNQPKSLFVELTSKAPSQSISRVTWFNPINETTKKPMYDFNHLADSIERCNALVAKQPWLLNWLKGTPKRRISISIAGDKCFDSTEQTLSQVITPNWKDLNLPGKPFLMLRLEEWYSPSGLL